MTIEDKTDVETIETNIVSVELSNNNTQSVDEVVFNLMCCSYYLILYLYLK